jgi:hypothetical protein
MQPLFNIVQRNKFAFSLAILICLAILYFFNQLPAFQVYPSLFSLIITLDLLLVIPLIYFLIIKDTKIPKTTVVPILILCFTVGTFILPREHQYFLGLFKTWVLPIVELTILSYLFIKVRSVIIKYQKNKTLQPDFFSALKETCASIFPPSMVSFIAIEVAVFYYGFIHWRKLRLSDTAFTYHQKSGAVYFIGALIFIILVETFVVHLLVQPWSVLTAWILTGISLYTCLQCFGFLRSLSKRPFFIQDHRLFLRYGILAEVDIDIHDIESVELTRRLMGADTSMVQLSPFKNLESCNVILRLKKEYVLTGLYGKRKSFQQLALYVDDKLHFHAFLSRLLHEEVNG